MALCDVCSVLSFDRFLQEESIKHRTLEGLQLNSPYCILCRLIFETIRRNIANFVQPWQSVEETNKVLGELKSRLVSLRFPPIHAANDATRDRLYIDVQGPLPMVDGWLLLSQSDVSLSLLRAPDTPQIKDVSIPVGRRIENDAASETLHRIVYEWVAECNNNHTNCRLSAAETPLNLERLPTRVLDLGGADESCQPYILETLGLRGRYVALSHAWGLHRHIVTTKINLESHLRDIPYVSLPKTFQDAMVMTRRLDVRYLWIDSLCIVQDDVQDWKTEAAKMADVYRNACCTIAATGSRGDHEGIFVDRVPQDICNLRYHRDDANLLVTYIEEDINTLKDFLMYAPLSQRAWCLQEKLLSPRIIHFTQTRAIWECRTRFETEDLLVLGPQDFGSLLNSTLFSFSTNRAKWLRCLDAVGKVKVRSQDISNLALGSSNRAPKRPFLDFNQLWYNLLYDYSRRGITKTSDKLIALSGVAQEVQEMTGLKYCAGQWLDMVALGLSWTYGDEPTTRASVYRAPSWSWASVDGGVAHVTEQGTLNGESLPDVVLIDCTVEIGNDGQISSGSLVLSGQVRLGTLVPFIWSSPTRRCRVRYDTDNDPSSTRNLGTVYLDDVAWWEPLDFDDRNVDRPALSRLFHLLRLNTRHWHTEDPYRDRTTYEILVLEEINATGHFKRIGAGVIKDEPFFEGLPCISVKMF